MLTQKYLFANNIKNTNSYLKWNDPTDYYPSGQNTCRFVGSVA